MAATSFKVRGIEPPDLGQFPPETRKLYWSWVVELGLRVKGKEILAGWDKDGKPLRSLKQETKDHRKSAMSPSGKGDPSGTAIDPRLAEVANLQPPGRSGAQHTCRVLLAIRRVDRSIVGRRAGLPGEAGEGCVRDLAGGARKDQGPELGEVGAIQSGPSQAAANRPASPAGNGRAQGWPLRGRARRARGDGLWWIGPGRAVPAGEVNRVDDAARAGRLPARDRLGQAAWAACEPELEEPGQRAQVQPTDSTHVEPRPRPGRSGDGGPRSKPAGAEETASGAGTTSATNVWQDQGDHSSSPGRNRIHAICAPSPRPRCRASRRRQPHRRDGIGHDRLLVGPAHRPASLPCDRCEIRVRALRQTRRPGPTVPEG